MLFSHIDILDENLDHQKDCFVGVRGNMINYVGKEPPKEDFGEIYDGSGRLLMPGLVNAHSHSAMTLMRGYGENLALSDWLNKRIFPFEAKLDGRAVYNGVMLAAAEMLRFGVTSTTDMYFFAEETARAVTDSGIRMNFSVATTCFDDSSYFSLPAYREAADVVKTLNNAAHGRFVTDLALHAEYTTTPRVVEELAGFAKEQGLNIHVHLSETKSEHEECKARRGGRTPAKYFRDLGVFDARTTAAHCVWAEDEDIDIFAEKGVTVASCPVSNLKLASGFCRAPQIIKKGVNYALGTDSVASNNNLNLFEEMKLFATLFKATTGDPTAITPKQAIYAATRAGALAQGREDIGLIKEGFIADLIVLDMNNKPWLSPCHDILNNIVFSALGSDVCLTMVDGYVLYRDGLYTFFDAQEIARKAEDSVSYILSRL